MQTQIALEDYKNTPGWHVALCGDTHLYIIVSNSGKTMNGRYTNRIFAETFLKDYLEAGEKLSQRAHKAKKEKNAPEPKGEVAA